MSDHNQSKYIVIERKIIIESLSLVNHPIDSSEKKWNSLSVSCYRTEQSALIAGVIIHYFWHIIKWKPKEFQPYLIWLCYLLN